MPYMYKYMSRHYIKGTVSRDFFMNHLYPDITAEPYNSVRYRNVAKIFAYPGCVDTGGNETKIYIDRSDKGGPFVTGVNNAGGKLPPLSTTPAENCVKNLVTLSL